MDMPSVLLKFNNNKEETVKLLRVPVAGDWIDIRGTEFLASKIVMKAADIHAGTNVIVIIDGNLNTDKPTQVAGPRRG